MIERIDFDGRLDLAKGLAEAVAENLRQGLAERGIASLAVSGGTTPARFFARLGKTKDIDWEKVIVTLVDERWVPETADRSNAGLVNETMLQGPAAVAKFVPLYSGGDEPDAEALRETEQLLSAVPMPFDAVVLGMGSDGHTASFFPGGDNLEVALTGTATVVSMRAIGAGEPRVTLTLHRLLDTRALYLHIEGEEKAEVLAAALGEGPVEAMPVRAVLRQTIRPVSIFWCP